MSYEYIRSGEKIIDLGIGTGLASESFARAGLKMYGIDYSEEMLSACREKGFAEVRRVTRPGGIFAVTFAPSGGSADYQKEETPWGVPIFKHSSRYIRENLHRINAKVLKEQRLLIKGAASGLYRKLPGAKSGLGTVCRLNLYFFPFSLYSKYGSGTINSGSNQSCSGK